MLKKPLFWIIVVIVIVILWFVFAGRGKHDATKGMSQQTASTSQPATPAPATPATSGNGGQ